MKASIVSALLGAAMVAQAHPGQSHAEMAKEIEERSAYLSTHKRSLDHCADKLKARGNDAIMHARRSAMVDGLRKKRSIGTDSPYLRARDLDSILATSHETNLTGITPNTDAATLFAGANACILSPEVTQGPYYVQGELVRQNIVDGQQGVDMTMDIQIIDVNTCEPVPNVYLEAWHCNSTGVYSGVVASSNGDSSDTANLDTTFLRGIQKSNDDGVVTFDTLFPGHYTSRATHIHVLTHVNETENTNKTLASTGSVTHVGQLFFDQDLISLVEASDVYNTNTQELTTNADDSILSEEASDVDPIMEYVLLGDDVTDGIFAWIAFGMDTSSNYTISPAAYLYADGGVENENSQMGGGGGGAAPTGAPPS
ncbi:aromatic compound dioxygenase [Massarina eburnea CBS 473.64]|uniref:Aromatic compound dioxygenase n=1 Tax=Massarina eburnea CBS 473.64 TaxID=1395130 RepID=A0A6A6RPA1_9PLEO|nr:aromatic compound dioxygenase [Massarina eburnea CBS 473.64]